MIPGGRGGARCCATRTQVHHSGLPNYLCSLDAYNHSFESVVSAKNQTNGLTRSDESRGRSA